MAAETTPQGGGRRLRAYRLTLDPTPVQAEVLGQHADAARWAYNFALGQKKAANAAWRLQVDELVCLGFSEKHARKVAAEAIDLLDGEHVAVADVGQRLQERGPVVGLQLAADLLFDDLPADGVEGVVLPLGVLLVGADPDQTDERHDDRLPFIKRAARGR